MKRVRLVVANLAESMVHARMGRARPIRHEIHSSRNVAEIRH
jgi:hypothetical protein